MASDPENRFVQPAEGIVIVSSPVLTPEQLAELERKRRALIEAKRRERERERDQKKG